MSRQIVMTAEGVRRLEEELDRLRGPARQELAARLRNALEMGRELTENAEYLSAKEEQARLELRIAELEDRLEHAQVVERTASRGTVDVGAHVRLRDRDARKTEEYDIVGSGEGNPSAGRISRDSPIASALLGHSEGELVEVETPAGIRHLKILAVR
jgi:transcription elongation factor GreA